MTPTSSPQPINSLVVSSFFFLYGSPTLMNECSITKNLQKKNGRGLITKINITKVSKKQKVNLNMESIYVAVWELRDNPSDIAILCSIGYTTISVFAELKKT